MQPRSAPEDATPHAAKSGPAVPRRDSILIVTCMGLATVLAWLYLIHLDHQMSPAAARDQMMAAMGMASNTPWTATDLLFTSAMWAVMMVGMMAPSVTPMILLFLAAEARGRNRAPFLGAGVFALGYLAVWSLFSVLAALAQWGLHEAAMLSPAMSVLNQRLGGAVLMVAGAYQLSPWKSLCLTHCRSPLNFLMTRWRPGRMAAFSIGAHHGVFCLGCCWALMAILFAVGVMNLLWVAVLTVFVLLEKIGPKGAVLARLGGVALLVAGVVWIV